MNRLFPVPYFFRWLDSEEEEPWTESGNEVEIDIEEPKEINEDILEADECFSKIFKDHSEIWSKYALATNKYLVDNDFEMYCFACRGGQFEFEAAKILKSLRHDSEKLKRKFIRMVKDHLKMSRQDIRILRKAMEISRQQRVAVPIQYWKLKPKFSFQKIRDTVRTVQGLCHRTIPIPDPERDKGNLRLLQLDRDYKNFLAHFQNRASLEQIHIYFNMTEHEQTLRRYYDQIPFYFTLINGTQLKPQEYFDPLKTEIIAHLLYELAQFLAGNGCNDCNLHYFAKLAHREKYGEHPFMQFVYCGTDNIRKKYDGYWRAFLKARGQR